MRILRRLLFVLVLMASPSLVWSQGITNPPGSVFRSAQIRNPSSLAAESLTNGALTSGTSWTRSTDFALVGNAVTYTHSAGAGTFEQISTAAAIPFASGGINGWFSFTYTTSAVTGTPTCTIRGQPDDFVGADVALSTAAGTYTQVFQADVDTLNYFLIRCISSSAATITFDNLSLKQINGGDLTVQGRMLAGLGTAAAPAYSFVASPTTGMSFAGGNLFFGVAGVTEWNIAPLNLYPSVTDTREIGVSTVLVKNLYLSRSIQGSKAKTLTETVPTATTEIAIGVGAIADAVVHWNVYAADATDYQSSRGSTYLAAVNKAGTETCTVGDIGTPVVAVSVGTLTCTTSCITGLSSAVRFALDCTSSLTQTGLVANVRLDMLNPQTVTPQ